jgi:hypothetical protein
MQSPRLVLVVLLAALVAVTVLGSAYAQVDARAIAMGSAFVGLADDVSATFYNPAALPFMEHPGFTVMRTLNHRSDPGALDFVSGILPIDSYSVVGVSYLRTQVASLAMYDFSLDWQQNWWWVSYGYKIQPTTGLGLNVRWISDDVTATEDGVPVNISSDTQTSVDLAAYHWVNERTSVGLMVQNANEPETSIQFPEEAEVTGDNPRTYTLGVAARSADKTITAVAEVYDLTDAVQREIRIGLERTFCYQQWSYALRGGYMSGEDALTFGAGMNFHDWTLDAAMVLSGDRTAFYSSLTGYF